MFDCCPFSVCRYDQGPSSTVVTVAPDRSLIKRLGREQGTVRERLDEIAGTMREVIEEQGREVVVHCAMGMERSVLAVVWYLHGEADITLDEAYDLVYEARPIAVDRRHWIYS